MAYDPTNGTVHRMEGPSITSGHYSLRADDYDARLFADAGRVKPEDPVEAAQAEAFEAVATVNLALGGERTLEAGVRAERLAKRAAAMASDANLSLLGKEN